MSTPKKSAHPLHRIPLEKWQALYDLAFRLWDMAPWEQMEETEIFGIQPAASPEPWFVSVMGAIGEFRAITFYDGMEGLRLFWQIQTTPGNSLRDSGQVLNTPQLMAAFGEAGDIFPEEKKLLKQIGYAPRGKRGWPYFRSYRAGYAPWILEPAEADCLLTYLTKALEFLPQYLADPGLLPPTAPGADVLVLVEKADGWARQLVKPTIPLVRYDFKLPMAVIHQVRDIPRTTHTFELGLWPLPMYTGEKNERPQIPYMLLLTDRESSFILGAQLLSVNDDGGWPGMMAKIPDHLMETLLKHKVRPTRIHVSTPWLEKLLDPPGRATDVYVEYREDMSAQMAVLGELLNSPPFQQ